MLREKEKVGKRKREGGRGRGSRWKFNVFCI